jgi:ABC-type nitrate/sulfonate/bicarbonate transport system permease component
MKAFCILAIGVALSSLIGVIIDPEMTAEIYTSILNILVTIPVLTWACIITLIGLWCMH